MILKDKKLTTWSDIKSKVSSRVGLVFYETIGLSYYVYLESYAFHYFTELVIGDSDANDFDTNYKAQSDLNYKIYRRSENYDNIVIRSSHDFSDKRTWYQNSTQKLTQTMTTADDTIYSFPDNNVVDPYWITDRDLLTGNPYDWKIYKNDILITTGFTFNHVNNKVVFTPANEPTDVIKASYYVAGSSDYIYTPDAGKFFGLKYLEVQMSKSCSFNDQLLFEAIINNATTVNTDYVGGKTTFNGARDIYTKANCGNGTPAFAELTNEVIVIPWNYLSEYKIVPVGTKCDSANLNQFNKIRVRLRDNIPPTNCEIATITFYAEEGKL